MWARLLSCHELAASNLQAAALQDLEDEDADEDDDAADAGAPKRPGADKRKLAEAFERERSKQKRAKEAADSKVCCLSAYSLAVASLVSPVVHIDSEGVTLARWNQVSDHHWSRLPTCNSAAQLNPMFVGSVAVVTCFQSSFSFICRRRGFS